MGDDASRVSRFVVLQ